MKAIKCDRCGKTYIPADDLMSCATTSYNTIKVAPVYSADIFVKDANRNMEGVFDLSTYEICDVCYNSILYFLNNPNTVVVSNNELYNKPQEV